MSDVKVSFKILAGFSITNLEKVVNEFLATVNPNNVEYIGSPQMFGHSEYIQAVEVVSYGA